MRPRRPEKLPKAERSDLLFLQASRLLRTTPPHHRGRLQSVGATCAPENPRYNAFTWARTVHTLHLQHDALD